MTTVISKDGQKYYIQTTSRVYGPGQENGLSFGTHYNWVSKDGENWTKTDFRSQLQLKSLIEETFSTALDEIFV